MKLTVALALTLLPLPLMAQAKPTTPAQKSLTGSYRRGEFGSLLEALM